MNLFEGLSGLDDAIQKSIDTQETYQTAMLYPDPAQYADAFSAYKSEPVLYSNMGTMICSPYPEDNWGNVSSIVSMLDEELKLPTKNDNIDPNKIYTQDIAALRTLAADQVRVTKLFEKKLTESLKEKDKFGLNENDIMAMQALTAARSAVTAINKEQIQIKKNIADIKIKQQQNNNRVMSNAQGVQSNDSPSGYTNSSMIGRQIMDDIFNMEGSYVPIDSSNYHAQSTGLEQAEQVLDSLIPVSQTSVDETANPTTYVVVDSTGNPLGFETYDDNGNLMPEYNNPESSIVSVDTSMGEAEDDLKRKFPIIQR